MKLFNCFKPVLGSLLLMMIAFSCTSQKNESITNITAKEFAQITQNKDIRILDVRTAPEFSSGHVKGAVPADVQEADFEEKVQAVYSDKSQPVYVYCKSGKRSMMAAEKMKALGYEQIFNVEGGIDAIPVEIITKAE